MMASKRGDEILSLHFNTTRIMRVALPPFAALRLVGEPIGGVQYPG